MIASCNQFYIILLGFVKFNMVTAVPEGAVSIPASRRKRLSSCGNIFTSLLEIDPKCVIHLKTHKCLRKTQRRRDGFMKIEEIKEIAKQHNIKTGKAKKSDLVRTIQHAEGNEQCFDSGKVAQCGQERCAWREDCA